MGVKEYKLPNGKTAVFEYDEYGIGKITLEAMDLLMGLIKADLVRCGECKYQYMCGHQINRHGLTLKLTCCEYGERRKESR